VNAKEFSQLFMETETACKKLARAKRLLNDLLSASLLQFLVLVSFLSAKSFSHFTSARTLYGEVKEFACEISIWIYFFFRICGPPSGIHFLGCLFANFLMKINLNLSPGRLRG
jgi:hypothetical protein